MSRNEDPSLRATTEWGVLRPILLGLGEKSSRLLGQVSLTLASPLHQWFGDRVTKAIAVALDAALRGEARSDHGGVAEYLGGLPHATLWEIVAGRPVPPWKACEFEASALAAVGGFNALDPSPELEAKLAGPPQSYARVLRSLVERDRAVEALREVAKEVQRSPLHSGPSDAISSGIDRLAAMLSGGSSGRNLGECLTSAVDQAKATAELREQGQSNPATWGLPELDLLCPLRPGMLVVLSAPPGAGKTSLALQASAATAEQGGKGAVSIASLEMTGEELATILVARELKIAPSAIREWTATAARNEDQIRQLAAQWQASESMMVRDLESGGQRQTAAAITAWLRQRRTVTANRLALGVLDYLQLLDGEARATEYQTITQATRTLKRTALSLRIPILCLAQMNREGRKADRNHQGEVTQNPEPRLEDLKGSGSIEQDADAVLFIHCPNPRSTEPSIPGKIIVAKQRGGATGSIDVIFHRRHQVFCYQSHEVPGLPSTPAPRPSDQQAAREPDDSEDLFGGGPR